jgi:hypothetical protein
MFLLRVSVFHCCVNNLYKPLPSNGFTCYIILSSSVLFKFILLYALHIYIIRKVIIRDMMWLTRTLLIYRTYLYHTGSHNQGHDVTHKNIADLQNILFCKSLSKIHGILKQDIIKPLCDSKCLEECAIRKRTTRCCDNLVSIICFSRPIQHRIFLGDLTFILRTWLLSSWP